MGLSHSDNGGTIFEAKESSSHFPNSDYSYSIEWITGPHNVGLGESQFKLRLWNKDAGTLYGPYLEPSEKVCAFIWMKMPDGSEHGSSPLLLEKLSETNGPVYLYKEAYFIMNGTWSLYIKLIKPSETCKEIPSQKAISEIVHEITIR